MEESSSLAPFFKEHQRQHLAPYRVNGGVTPATCKMCNPINPLLVPVTGEMCDPLNPLLVPMIAKAGDPPVLEEVKHLSETAP